MFFKAQKYLLHLRRFVVFRFSHMTVLQLYMFLMISKLENCLICEVSSSVLKTVVVMHTDTLKSVLHNC